MATFQPYWYRAFGDALFSTADFAQWNNNLFALSIANPPGAVRMARILVDFSVSVTLDDQVGALQWAPYTFGDMNMLAGCEWAPTGVAGAPDLKATAQAPLLLTAALPMTDRWEFTNSATGGHEQVARWQTTQSLDFDSFRSIPVGEPSVAVNFGFLPYFDGSVVHEGNVFSARCTCYARVLWLLPS